MSSEKTAFDTQTKADFTHLPLQSSRVGEMSFVLKILQGNQADKIIPTPEQRVACLHYILKLFTPLVKFYGCVKLGKEFKILSRRSHGCVAVYSGGERALSLASKVFPLFNSENPGPQIVYTEENIRTEVFIFLATTGEIVTASRQIKIEPSGLDKVLQVEFGVMDDERLARILDNKLFNGIILWIFHEMPFAEKRAEEVVKQLHIKNYIFASEVDKIKQKFALSFLD